MKEARAGGKEPPSRARKAKKEKISPMCLQAGGGHRPQQRDGEKDDSDRDRGDRERERAGETAGGAGRLVPPHVVS